jgi:hypothetical protein
VVIDRCGTAVDDLGCNMLRPPYLQKHWADWADQRLWAENRAENSTASHKAGGREGVNLWRYYKFWLKDYRAAEEFDLFTARHFLKLTGVSAATHTLGMKAAEDVGQTERGDTEQTEREDTEQTEREDAVPEGHSFLHYFVRKCEELVPEDSFRVALCVTQNYTRLQAAGQGADSSDPDFAQPLPANEWYCDLVARSGTTAGHWSWLERYRGDTEWLARKLSAPGGGADRPPAS